MIEDTIEELRDAIGKALDALKRDLARVRTGRANAQMLDSVRVDYYGTPTPIQQMASVTVPEARLLMVKPWDKSTVPLVEKALRTSSLDFNPQSDGEIIRIPVPPLTEERRKGLVKVARENGEKCKVAIRAARHDARDMMDAFKKDGDFGEDEVDRAMKRVEATVQEGTASVDDIIAAKEKDIMQI